LCFRAAGRKGIRRSGLRRFFIVPIIAQINFEKVDMLCRGLPSNFRRKIVAGWLWPP
jgi:hypothetical protein